VSVKEIKRQICTARDTNLGACDLPPSARE
jgi:hypothetical protein